MLTNFLLVAAAFMLTIAAWQDSHNVRVYPAKEYYWFFLNIELIGIGACMAIAIIMLLGEYHGV